MPNENISFVRKKSNSNNFSRTIKLKVICRKKSIKQENDTKNNSMSDILTYKNNSMKSSAETSINEISLYENISNDLYFSPHELKNFEEIPKIVETLVLDKYKYKINKYMERSLQRRMERNKRNSILLKKASDSSSQNNLSLYESAKSNTNSILSNHFHLNNLKIFNSSELLKNKNDNINNNYKSCIKNSNKKLEPFSKEIKSQKFASLSKYNTNFQVSYASIFSNEKFPESLDKFENTTLPIQNEAADNSSVDTCNISDLISKRCSAYSTPFRKPIPILNIESLSNLSVNDYDFVNNSLSTNSKGDLIWDDILLQDEIILQVSKALSICSKVEINLEPQLVEAEKVLLFATYKKRILEEELNKIDQCQEESKNNLISGSVIVEDLKFLPKSMHYIEIERKQYFVCLLNHKSTIYATDIVEPDENGVVFFQNQFKFAGLKADFRINVCLFKMRSKYPCMAIKKKQSFVRKLFKCCKTLENNGNNRECAFTPWGNTTLQLLNIKNDAIFKLEDLPIDSHLSLFTAKFNQNIHTYETKRGFLTISKFTGNCPIWNRKWCILDGFFLKYWNHPSETNYNKPINILDLRYCVRNNVKIVGRELCSRSKTLLLEFYTKERSKRIMYLASADTNDELKSWQSRFNLILAELNEWNYKCLV